MVFESAGDASFHQQEHMRTGTIFACVKVGVFALQYYSTLWGVFIQQTGMVDWTTGLDYWNRLSIVMAVIIHFESEAQTFGMHTFSFLERLIL